jgi:hypothetical protein
MSIIDVLDQDVFWIGQDGLRHELVTMHQEHRLNLLERLRRDCESLARQRDRLLHEREGLRPVDVRRSYPSAADWIENSPLVRALKVAIALHDVIDGEIVDVRPGEPGQLELAARLLKRRENR